MYDIKLVRSSQHHSTSPSSSSLLHIDLVFSTTAVYVLSDHDATCNACIHRRVVFFSWKSEAMYGIRMHGTVLFVYLYTYIGTLYAIAGIHWDGRCQRPDNTLMNIPCLCMEVLIYYKWTSVEEIALGLFYANDVRSFAVCRGVSTSDGMQLI